MPPLTDAVRSASSPLARSWCDRIGFERNSWILASVPTVALTPLRSLSTCCSALHGFREERQRGTSQPAKTAEADSLGVGGGGEEGTGVLASETCVQGA